MQMEINDIVYHHPRANESVKEKLKHQRSMKYAINKNNQYAYVWNKFSYQYGNNLVWNLKKIENRALPRIKKYKELQKLCNTYRVQHEPPANGETQTQRVLRLSRIISGKKLKGSDWSV